MESCRIINSTVSHTVATLGTEMQFLTNYIGKQVLNLLMNILRTQKFFELVALSKFHLPLLNTYRTLFSNCIASNTSRTMLNHGLFLTFMFSHLLAFGLQHKTL